MKKMKREKKPFHVRLSDDDHEFLKSTDAPKFIHEKIEEQKRTERASGTVKPLAHEIVQDLAEAFVKDFEESYTEDQGCWDESIGHCLFDISTLTLKAVRKDAETGEEKIIPPTRLNWLEGIMELTKEKESKEFLMHIKEMCGEIVIGKEWHPQPVSEEDMETIRQVYAEAKILLERRYRKVFHNPPPQEWSKRYATTTSGFRNLFVYFSPP